MINQKNRDLLDIFTSTGTMIVNDEGEKLFLFYDKYSGFVKTKNSTFFLNNIHMDIQRESNVKLFNFFFSYPLNRYEKTIFEFFKHFLTDVIVDCSKLKISDELENNQFSQFIYEIGTLEISTESEQRIEDEENRKILEYLKRHE